MIKECVMQRRIGIKGGYRGSASFSRFMRSLDADGFRPSIFGILLVSALIGAWAAWFFLARVALYEVTDTARLEVDRAIYPIEALAAGRVVATHLAAGKEVQAGDVLVELDADAQRLQLQEESARLAALAPQLVAIRDEIAAEKEALGRSRDASRVGVDEARAQFREAEAAARFAELEAERLARLHAGGLLAEVDLLRARAEAQRRRATAESLQLAVDRMEREQSTKESDRKVRLERLQHEITQLEGQRTTTAATIERIQNEIEKRRIRAPVAGPLGEVATLRIGAVVREGDRLGAVVPPGKLRVVAEFPPPAALGRVRPGQPARLRLEGFPWAQYGSIRATVGNVASEIRAGRVRVELEVDAEPVSRIPLQHGLPGAIEVEVERVSPAALVLRAAGKLLASPAVRVSGTGGG